MTDSSANGATEPAPQVLDPNKVVIERMRSVRKAQGLSVHDLVDRLADIGRGDITANKVWNMQAGRVKPTFDAVLAIANALGVSPLTFLTMPDDSDISIEISPGVEISPVRFNAWATGTRPLPGGDESLFTEHHPFGAGLTRRRGSPEERAQALVTRLSARLAAANEVIAALEAEAAEFTTGVGALADEDLPEEQRRAINALTRSLGLEVSKSKPENQQG